MTAEEIVKRLAEGVWTVHYGGSYHSCGLCEAFLPVRPEDHREDCLWMLAIQWEMLSPLH